MCATRLFVQRAMNCADELPTGSRADLYEIAADLLSRAGSHNEAEAATTAAKNLREADSAQLLFRNLLSA